MTLRRYLTWLIALCVTPLLLLSVVLAIEHVRDVRGLTDQDAQAVARRVATAIDDELRTEITALQALAASPLADDAGRQAEFHREAQNHQRFFGHHVIKVDAHSRAIVLSTRLPFGADMPPLPRPAGRSAVDAAALSGKPEIGDAFVGPTAGVPLVALAVPMLQDRRAPFFLLATIETTRFAQPIAQADPPPGWTVTLHDSRGGLLFRQGPEPAGAADPGPALRSGRALALAPWRVQLEVPRSEYMRPVVVAAAIVGTELLTLTLAAVVGGGIAARRLSLAMQKLVSTATGTEHDAPASGIREIASVQTLLRDATRRREQAEAERRSDEQRHRESMTRASLQLQLSEARLRGMFETASEGIVTVDADQRIVLINPAAARIVGYRVDELLGRPLAMLIPQRYREQHLRNLRAFGEAERASIPMSARPSLLALHAGGHEIPIEAAVSHVHVDGQRLFTVIFRDVTERLRGEEQLRREKAKLDAALASMTDAVCIADAEGRLVQFNDAFVSFHRFASRAEFPTSRKAFFERVELLDDSNRPLPLDQRMLGRALNGEAASNVECRLRRSDTGEQWVGSYSFAPIRDAAGLITGAVLVGRDVTAMRQMHAEVLASHVALRRLVAAQDKIQEEERKRVARELHDDLQQTLAAIKMDTLVIDQQLQHEPARVPPMLAKIDELATAAIASTRRIVNDLRPRMLEELGLRPALEALASDFAQRTGIDCRLSLADEPDDEGEIAPAVATCLYRVAQEGLNNVHKHSGAKHVRISLARGPQARVRLRIADDGKGLSPADRQKRYSFGLVGMDERVHAVGGQLQLSSMPGGGTVIEVDVPAHDESRASGY